MRADIQDPTQWPSAAVGKFRDTQIATRATWARVPDDEIIDAAMHVIHVTPANGTTITEVNPLDPGTVGDQGVPGWYECPATYGHLTQTRRP